MIGSIYIAVALLATCAVASQPSLTISPSEITLRGPRDRAQLVLTLTVSDAPTDVTREAAWQSTNEAVVTVDAQGVVQAIGDGGAAIVVRCGADSLTVPVAVGPPGWPG